MNRGKGAEPLAEDFIARSTPTMSDSSETWGIAEEQYSTREYDTSRARSRG